MERVKLIRIFLILLVVCFNANAAVVKEDYTHHSLYIHHFIRYIQCPNVSNTLVVGVSGGNPAVMEALEKMALSRSTPELKLEVKKVLSPGDVATCHILFIPETESGKTAVYAARTDSQRLIITEGKGMLLQGGMINFVVVDKKLRFEMNQEAIEKAGFKVSNSLTVMAVQRI